MSEQYDSVQVEEQQRTLIAAMCLQGLLAGDPKADYGFKDAAKDAVEHADALIKELKKTRGKR